MEYFCILYIFGLKNFIFQTQNLQREYIKSVFEEEIPQEHSGGLGMSEYYIYRLCVAEFQSNNRTTTNISLAEEESIVFLVLLNMKNGDLIELEDFSCVYLL